MVYDGKHIMASQKPRYGGVQKRMDDSKQIHNTNMADNSEERDTCRDVSFRADLHHETSKEHIRYLMKVFQELGIKSQPKPYVRYPDEKNVDVRGHVETQLETLENLSLLNRNLVSKDSNVIYCKNLFLKDRKGQFYIVVCLEEHSVDLKMLKKCLNAHRNLSFADREALWAVLQLHPGEVTPLAIMHRSAKDVRVAIHSKLADAGTDAKFAFHPLSGHLQIDLSYSELVAFIEYFDRKIEFIEDETSHQRKEASKKQKRDLTNAKSKEKLNLKFTMKEIKNPNSNVGSQDIEDCSATFITGRQNVTGAASDEPTDPVEKRNILNEECNTFCDKKMESSAVETKIFTKFTAQAEIHHTIADCEESDQNSQSHKYSQPFLNRQKSTDQWKVSKQQDRILIPNEFPNENYFDQSEPLRQEKDSGGAEESLHGKTRKRIFLSRKGKLRSYVKKNAEVNIDPDGSAAGAQHRCDSPNQEERNSGEAHKSRVEADREHKPGDEMLCLHGNSALTVSSTESLQVLSLKYYKECDSAHGMTAKSMDKKKCETISNDELETEQRQTTHTKLGVIEQFYSSLTDAQVKHRETDLSREGDSAIIEPSVGCRCFLLKDKGENFFFVISHELYELDFGRLKAALKPKKKLMVAHPADVIMVLGVDPMRVTPFAVLTMRDPQPRVYITRKVMAPNLKLCIQHPFAQARRILMSSAQLQNYFTFLGLHFGAVEERLWNDRFNLPFSQFDSPENGSDRICDEKNLPGKSNAENGNMNWSNLSSEPNKRNETQNNRLSNVLANLNILHFFLVLRHMLSQNSFSLFTAPLFCSKTSMSNSANFVSGSSVDPPIVQMKQNPAGIYGPEHQGVQSLAEVQLQNISIPMRTEDLENHLLSLNIRFQLKKNKQHDDVPEPMHDISRDSAILERCAIMYLTNSSRHNFLIIGAQDDFPMSVKRFCRRSRIREHLDIRIDPQEDSESHLLWDIAPGMAPFALAFAGLKNLIWEKFDSIPSTLHPFLKSFNHKKLLAPIPSTQSLEHMSCPAVTVALTTTLYIDPETVMEFDVGKERSRLRIKSSEFVKYCREVGFDMLYY